MYNKEFSMHSVREMDHDLEKSLHDIMKVKQLGDLSQSLLKQTNKDTVLKLVNVLTSSLKRSSDLLRAAGADIDQLQSNQIRLQSELLLEKEKTVEHKNEELREMKKNMKTEMKSWADIVSKNVKSSEITPKVIKEAVKSAVEEDRGEEDRSHNIMVYGLKEQEDSAREDTAQLVAMMGELEARCDDVTLIRVGSVKEGSVQPVKLTFKSKEDVFYVLSRARVLKDSINFSTVFLGPDRSVEERKAHRKLVEELKKKRTENPDRFFFIKQGTVCSKPRETTEQDVLVSQN